MERTMRPDDEIPDGLHDLIEGGVASPIVMTFVTFFAGVGFAAYGRQGELPVLLFAGVAWAISSAMAAYSWFAKRGSRSGIFGALGAMVACSLWVVFSTLVVLGGEKGLPWQVQVALSALFAWHLLTGLRIVTVVRRTIADL